MNGAGPGHADGGAPQTRLAAWPPPTVRADLSAGIAAALVAVPVSIGYGLFAFAPLGPAYFATGAMAGLYCSVLMGITALALGARSQIIYGARNVVSFMINALVLHVLVRTHSDLLAQLPQASVVSLVLLFGFLAGLLQMLFGCLRLGNAVKYVPHPVIAGFQSTAALFLVAGQSDAVLGFVEPVPLLELPWRLTDIDLVSVAVAAITVAACTARPRQLSRVPPLLVGGLVGTLCFHAVPLLLPGVASGPVIGAIPGGLPTPAHALDFWWLLTSEQTRPLLPALATGALSVAIVCSLDALLAGKVVATLDRQPLRGNQELIRVGAGNVVGACFGAIPGGVALATSLASQRAGARTALAGVFLLILVALIVTLLDDVLAIIPRAVIGGLLIVVGLGFFDRWSVRLVAQAMRGNPRPLAAAWREMSVFVVFAVIAIILGIVAAVAAGVAVSVAYFIVRMSRSPIRRSYRCIVVRSRRRRPPAEEAALARLGERIVVFELEGSIFFGSAENLANRLQAACRDSPTCVVLDLSRVTEIDLTGARILTRVNDLLTDDGHHLLLAGISRDSAHERCLAAAGTRAAVSRARIFPDTDRALEWAEDRLLIGAPLAQETTQPADAATTLEQIRLGRFDLFAGLPPKVLATLRQSLDLVRFERGAVLFSAGDSGDALYLMVEGKASVWLRAGTLRLVTFSPGTVVGELALVDPAPRSATVVADTDLVCLRLTVTAFERLAADHPATAIELIARLGRELAHRLRRANRTVLELDH